MEHTTTEHQRLQRLVGHWRGDDQVAETPFNTNGGMCITDSHMEPALNGLFVIANDRQTRDGIKVFQAHKIFGWDERIQKYTLHHFDSDGANPPTRAEGDWEGDYLSFYQHTPFGFVLYEYVFANANTFTYRMSTSSLGEEWVIF